SHTSSSVSCLKRSSWTRTSSPASRKACATTRPPSDRSTKKTNGSGSRTIAVLEPDRVFDELRRQLVVRGEILDGVTCAMPLGDDERRDAGSHDHGLAESATRIDHDRPGLVRGGGT